MEGAAAPALVPPPPHGAAPLGGRPGPAPPCGVLPVLPPVPRGVVLFDGGREEPDAETRPVPAGMLIDGAIPAAAGFFEGAENLPASEGPVAAVALRRLAMISLCVLLHPDRMEAFHYSSTSRVCRSHASTERTRPFPRSHVLTLGATRPARCQLCPMSPEAPGTFGPSSGEHQEAICDNWFREGFQTLSERLSNFLTLTRLSTSDCMGNCQFYGDSPLGRCRCWNSGQNLCWKATVICKEVIVVSTQLWLLCKLL